VHGLERLAAPGISAVLDASSSPAAYAGQLAASPSTQGVPRGGVDPAAASRSVGTTAGCMIDVFHDVTHTWGSIVEVSEPAHDVTQVAGTGSRTPQDFVQHPG
jgi:hypothetical protein